MLLVHALRVRAHIASHIGASQIGGQIAARVRAADFEGGEAVESAVEDQVCKEYACLQRVSNHVAQIAGARERIRFMDKLKLVVRGTSLGDVHSLLLYPAIASHREIAPKQRQRMGIGDGLVRLCAGIESVDDIIADLDQALS